MCPSIHAFTCTCGCSCPRSSETVSDFIYLEFQVAVSHAACAQEPNLSLLKEHHTIFTPSPSFLPHFLLCLYHILFAVKQYFTHTSSICPVVTSFPDLLESYSECSCLYLLLKCLSYLYPGVFWVSSLADLDTCVVIEIQESSFSLLCVDRTEKAVSQYALFDIFFTDLAPQLHGLISESSIQFSSFMCLSCMMLALLLQLHIIIFI